MQKAPINFVMSTHLSVRMEQLGSHWMDFHEFDILSFFEKIQVEIKYDINNGYFA
jgi:hypothetical protein